MSGDADTDYRRWWIEISGYVKELMEIARASPMHTSSTIDHAKQELVIVGVGEPTEALTRARQALLAA